MCIDCGKCAIVCPHAAIRMKVFAGRDGRGRTRGLLAKTFRSRELPDHHLTIQVAPDDCTGCGVCVDVCPADSRRIRAQGAQHGPTTHRDDQRAHWEHFLTIPALARDLIAHDSVKGSQLLEPLFEFSGACSGCGETPYLQAAHAAVRRPDGDRQRHRLLVDLRRQPADDAVVRQRGRPRPGVEQLAVRGQRRVRPRDAARARRPRGAGPPPARAAASRSSARTSCALLVDAASRPRPTSPPSASGSPGLRRCAIDGTPPDARQLLAIADQLVSESLWIVGGDGWAYDIGFGGLDHVLGSGQNVNMLVLDTEVYSNTGGQASKATPRGAVAKFAAAGKSDREEGPRSDRRGVRQRLRRSDRARRQRRADGEGAVRGRVLARAVAGHRVRHVHRPRHRHVDLDAHQKATVQSGFWPLYRFQPSDVEDTTRSTRLAPPTIRS